MFGTAGFDIEDAIVISKTIEFDPWVEQLQTSVDQRERLQSKFLTASPAALDRFQIEVEDGHVVSFGNLKLLARFHKPQQ